MKRIFFLISFFAVFLFLAPFSFAQTVQSGQSEVLPKDKVINSDYFVSGKEVEILGTINGDTYTAGANVIFNGIVNGDLFAAGGNVKILGVVHGNVRTAGGNVQVIGAVDKNITALGGNINIEKGAKIGGSLVAAGGTINIDSNLGKGLTVAGGGISIDGIVNGDVTAAVRELRLEYGTQILGNLTYLSQKEVIKSGNNKITGKITHNISAKKQTPNLFKFNFGFSALSFLAELLLGVLFLYFFPKFSGRISDKISNNLVSSFLWGLVFLIVAPIAGIILLFTVIGIPLAFLLFVSYVFLLYVGKILAAVFLGNWFSKNFNFSKNQYLLFGIGLLILAILRIIPIVGAIVGFVATLVGIGAYIIVENEFFFELRLKKLL